jgi:hypothetical protein
LYSRDPVDVYINHADQPVDKIKEMISRKIPRQASYLFGLDEFVEYTHLMDKRFLARLNRLELMRAR